MRDIYTAYMCSSGTFSSGPENDLKTTIESHFTHPQDPHQEKEGIKRFSGRSDIYLDERDPRNFT